MVLRLQPCSTGETYLYRVFIVLHMRNSFAEPDFRYPTAAGSVLHEKSSFSWKSPAVFQAFCKWGNCARAQCAPGNVVVLAIFCHLALKLGFSFCAEKLICPLEKNTHIVQNTAVADYWCKRLAGYEQKKIICLPKYLKSSILITDLFTVSWFPF